MLMHLTITSVNVALGEPHSSEVYEYINILTNTLYCCNEIFKKFFHKYQILHY